MKWNHREEHDMKIPWKKIHWQKFFTRKILVIAALVFALHLVDVMWHIHVAGRGGEMMMMGSLLEHLCFGVPVLDE